MSDTSIRPTLKPNNLCRSDSRIRHSNHSQIFSRCGHRLFCRIRVHVGRIPESDVSIIPEFSQCANIGFLSDTSIRPTSKPNNPRRSDSRIRRFNHSRISAMCGHRFFVGYKYPTYVETNNPCRSDTCIRHFNHSRKWLFRRIPVSEYVLAAFGWCKSSRQRSWCDGSQAIMVCSCMGIG